MKWEEFLLFSERKRCFEITMRSQTVADVAFAIFILLTWLVIAIYPIGIGQDHFGIGLLIGSMFGHCILASAWTVLGPGGWPRWPIAILWCCATSFAWYLQTVAYQSHGPFMIILGSGCVVAIVVQGMLWPLRLWLSFRITRPQELGEYEPEMPIAKQFGIQHLMIITTVVAVIVGVGRLMLPAIQESLAMPRAVPVFGFLVIVACVLWVPILFSMLAMRKALWPTITILIFTALATYFETPLLNQLGLGRAGPDWLHLTLINLFTIVPVVLAAFALRMNGYRLQRYRRAMLPTYSASS